MNSNLSPETQWLFAGIGGVLVLASAIAFVLKRRVAGGRPHEVIDNLVARINAWWVMVGVIGASFVVGRWGVLALFAFISAVALREYVRVAQVREHDRKPAIYMFALFLPLQYALIAVEWYGLYSIFIPVYAFLILPIIAALGEEPQRFLERCSKTQWGLMVCVFCISHIPALLTLNIPGFEGRGLQLIAFLALVVQGSDVLQYVWGKLLGRRKVAPKLSPSKTVEGLIGGVASATAIGASLYWLTPFTPLQAGAIAFTVCMMGFLGGLVMSGVKRDAGVKDWGQMIEGHGGMLDRLDSLAFAAPVYFHFIRYWWTP
jgi:phosphatidate cytidylyltransferase